MKSQLGVRKALLAPLVVLLVLPVQVLGNPRAVYALLCEAAGARAASQAARYGMVATRYSVTSLEGLAGSRALYGAESLGMSRGLYGAGALAGVRSLSDLRLDVPPTVSSFYSTADPSLRRYLTGGSSAYRNESHEDAVHNAVLRILEKHPVLLSDLPAAYDPNSAVIRRIREIYRQEERKPFREAHSSRKHMDVLRKQLMAKVFAKEIEGSHLVTYEGISAAALAEFAALHAIQEVRAVWGTGNKEATLNLARTYAEALAEGGVTYEAIAAFVPKYMDASDQAIASAKYRVKRDEIKPAIEEAVILR